MIVAFMLLAIAVAGWGGVKAVDLAVTRGLGGEVTLSHRLAQHRKPIAGIMILLVALSIWLNR